MRQSSAESASIQQLRMHLELIHRDFAVMISVQTFDQPVGTQLVVRQSVYTTHVHCMNALCTLHCMNALQYTAVLSTLQFMNALATLHFMTPHFTCPAVAFWLSLDPTALPCASAAHNILPRKGQNGSECQDCGQG